MIGRRLIREPLPWLGTMALTLLAVLVARNTSAVVAGAYVLPTMLTGLGLLATALWWPALRPDLGEGAALEAHGGRGGLAAAAILVVSFAIEAFSGADPARLDATRWAAITGALAVFTMTGWCASRALGARAGFLAGLVAAAYAALLRVIVGLAVHLLAPEWVTGTAAAPSVVVAEAVRQTIGSVASALIALPLLAAACALLGAGVAHLAQRPDPDTADDPLRDGTLAS